MKKIYISPELSEIKVEDVITASVLTVEPEGAGTSLNYQDLI